MIYTTEEYSKMQDFQKRVVDEYEALKIHTISLGQFMLNRLYFELDQPEQKRLYHQWKVMQVYGNILEERIENFT